MEKAHLASVEASPWAGFEASLAGLLRSRRSVRRFRSTPIPEGLLSEVVEAATWAPSGYNRQDWSLVVVRGGPRDEAVRVLAASASGWAERIRSRFSPEAADGLSSFFSTLGGAPVLVFVYAGREEAEALVSAPSAYASACAAVQNLLLAAHAAGLGACWVQAFCAVQPQLDRVLGVEGRVLVAGVPLGYPAETPRAPRRKRGRIRWLGWPCAASGRVAP